jgi:hypothetical protein
MVHNDGYCHEQTLHIHTELQCSGSTIHLISETSFLNCRCGSTNRLHARTNQNIVCMSQFLLDATSVYDNVSYRGISMACKSFAVPPDVEDMLLAHLGGHSRVVNTAYGLEEEDTKITLKRADGANSSPALFNFATAPAHRCADASFPGYTLPMTQSCKRLDFPNCACNTVISRIACISS